MRDSRRWFQESAFFRWGAFRNHPCLWMLPIFFLLSIKPVGAQDAELRKLDLLDAVTVTLKLQPNIHVQEEQVEIRRGGFQQATGQFDPTLKASGAYQHDDTPLASYAQVFGIDDQKLDTTSYLVGLTKQFRSGIVVSPNVQVIRETYPDYPYNTTNTSQVYFKVLIPLLRGSGAEAVAADERAAEKYYETSLLDLEETLSESVLSTVGSYWNYLAAQKILEQLKDAEARAERLVEETKALISADEIPSAELESLLANRASKMRSRIAGEQSLFEAKQSLGLAMGLPSEAIDAIPTPADDFPRLDPDILPRISALTSSLIQKALDRRADYKALQLKQERAKILVKAAKNNLLPGLDLTLQTGYSGLDEGADSRKFATSLDKNVPGFSVGASVTYEWPFGNNSAKGAFAQSVASHRQTVIATEEMGRNIRINIATAASSLVNNISELVRAQEAVSSYQRAVENEKMKFRLGWSTLLDVIDIEDRLTSALTSQISIQQGMAKALAQLRYESGTLLSADKDKASVSKEALVTVPSGQGN